MLKGNQLDFAALASSLAITFVVWALFYSYVLNEKDKELDFLAMNLSSIIGHRLENYEQVLFAGQGLFLASDTVTADEWQGFMKNQQLEQRFPGVQVVGYSKKIGNSEDLARHVQEMRINYPNYTVRPDTQREEYHSIIFIEPVNVRNLQAFGYDMFTESVRRAALEKARDTDTTSISGKVKLVQEISKDVQPGFLMYLPVYKNDQPHQTLEERQSAVEGYVYCAFRMYDLMDAITGDLADIKNSDIRFKIYDNTKSEENLLYDSKKGADESGADWHKTEQISFGHRTWMLEYVYAPKFSEFETITLTIIPIAGITMGIFVFFAIRSNRQSQNRINELNEDLIKNEKLSAIGQIASRFAHDIKNPLTIIKNTAEIIKSSDTLDKKTRMQVDRIERAASKINYQINDTLDFVRTKPLTIKETTIQKILAAVLDRIDTPSTVTINTSTNDHTIKCDATKIEVALANLITNAVQAVANNGTVNIRTKDEENTLVIEVEDSGPGIPENLLEKIFEPLFTTKQTGTGLGLASVKSIIQQHGGTVFAKNNPTTFTVRLPKAT